MGQYFVQILTVIVVATVILLAVTGLFAQFILGKDDCWIYRDNRTKAKWWYIKIYETRFRKTWSKSLKTTNKTVAIALAEEMYADRRGRLRTFKEWIKLVRQLLDELD